MKRVPPDLDVPVGHPPKRLPLAAEVQHRYCSHCRKHDHSDAECWSTRAIPAWNAPVITDGIRLVAERRYPRQQP